MIRKGVKIETSPQGNHNQTNIVNYPMKSTPRHTFSSRTAALLADTSTFGNAAVAAAAQKLKDDQAKEQEGKALAALQSADRFLKEKVNSLKALREREKAALAEVKKFDAALAQFVKDGNLEIFPRIRASLFITSSNTSGETSGAENVSPPLQSK